MECRCCSSLTSLCIQSGSQLLTCAHSCPCMLTAAHCWQALGPLPELIQGDQMWQQPPEPHGHAHPGSTGSKRTKLSITSSRGAACHQALAGHSKACHPDDLQIHHTLYNTGAAGLVHLTVKHQGWLHVYLIKSALLYNSIQHCDDNIKELDSQKNKGSSTQVVDKDARLQPSMRPHFNLSRPALHGSWPDLVLQPVS